MRKIKYLHVGSASIFFKPFIDIVDQKFCIEEHLFILHDSISSLVLKNEKNVKILNPRSIKSFYYHALIIWYLFRAKKVFFHGLFDAKVLLILWLMPFWKKRVYWLAWGADLYDRFYESKTRKNRLVKYLRANVVKHIKHIVTYIKGDYERAIEWFGCNAKYYECLMYPSNLYEESNLISESSDFLNIMIGNSADPMNHHLEVFEKISKNLPEKFRIFVPLSYGDKIYKKYIMKKGVEYFGDNFIVIDKIMSPFDYKKFLNSMDIVIFNHPIQQAMGNTITALGMGKNVYLRKETSQWELFSEMGVELRDISQIDLQPLKKLEDVNYNNKAKINSYFTKDNYFNQLRAIF